MLVGKPDKHRFLIRSIPAFREYAATPSTVLTIDMKIVDQQSNATELSKNGLVVRRNKMEKNKSYNSQK